MDWTQLHDSAQASPADLKKDLDLVLVCEALGIVLEPDHAGRWHGLCPFHDDNEPSLDVYRTDDGVQRVGCMACDFGQSNDVFDLLQKIRGYSFTSAMREAKDLLSSCRVGQRTDTSLDTVEQRKDVDLTRFVTSATERVAEVGYLPIMSLLNSRGIELPVEWVTEQFLVGVTPDGNGVVIPHYNSEGVVRAAKIRRHEVSSDRPWKPIAVRGSRLDNLYGVWRDQNRGRILLVEGESDVWTMSHALEGGDWDVFGLPSGSAAKPRTDWVEMFDGRDVTVMFDADDAGRIAIDNWRKTLGVISVARLPEGEDATSVGKPVSLQALDNATKLGTSAEPRLQVLSDVGYARPTKDGLKPVTDFSLRLTKTIIVEDEGQIYEVELPDGMTARASSNDFASDVALHRWATKHGRTAVNANKTDAREIERMLLLDQPLKPLVRGTRYVGLVDSDGTFVLPNEAVGPGANSWAYVPPIGDVKLNERLHLSPGPWVATVPEIMLALHDLRVTTPLVGWMAAAPLRSMIRSFPFLAITGIHGSGKSTIVREIMSTFGSRNETTLTSTTPYAVEAFFAASNAFPIWFDEYRYGARRDSKDKFDQLLRDAWDASTSFKGGQGDNLQTLHGTVARAPVVVSGEDALREGSHLERSVYINLPMSGRNPQALTALRQVSRSGFGRAYIEWLSRLVATHSVPRIPDILDRPRHSRSVAAWGYELLRAFTAEVCHRMLPDFDESLILEPHIEVQSRPVLLDALRAGVGRTSGGASVVWVENESNDILVHVPSLIRYCREHEIPVPGNSRAMENEIMERWPGTVAENHAMMGHALRVPNGRSLL